MNRMNIDYNDCLEIIESKPEEVQREFKKMVEKWEHESNLKREQAYFSFCGNLIYMTEIEMMTIADSISQALSY